MSVVGIDFGSTNCTIAAAQKGGVDILTNDVSSRITPCMAAFGEKERAIGEAALTQHQRNIANTITDVKLLLGKKWDDEEVQSLAKSLPYKLVELPNKEIGVQVTYAFEKKVFTPVAITAMILQKLKEIAEKGVQKTVKDVVVSIPGFWSDSQRRALLDASKIAGINCLRLIHDNTATAIQYGIYKTDLSDKDPKKVMFIDIGSSATQVAVVEFLKGQMKVVSTAYDRTLGGRDFDVSLVEHFAKEFKDKYKIDVKTNPKALIRTQLACEKLKKQLNMNPEVPMSIDSLMNDIDVRGLMKRVDYDVLIQPLLERLAVPINKALADAGLTPEQLSTVELSGSASRTLSVQNKISEILKNKEISKTTNPEESVARGCALQCAILSPLFKVREYTISDIYSYPVKASWMSLGDSKAVDGDSIELFSKNNVLPSPKQITLARDSGFNLVLEYADMSLFPKGSESTIGKFSIPNVPKKDGDAKIRVKVKLDIHGIINVESAQFLDTVDAPETPNTATTATSETKEEKPEDKGDAKSPEEKKENEKKKKVAKRSELAFTGATASLSEKEVHLLTEEEAKMEAADKLSQETADRKNAVESYVYAMRGKISDNLSSFATEQEKSTLSKLLDETENWLYEDGADLTKSAYVKKLDDLKVLGEPIVKRHFEHENRYDTLAQVRTSIENYKLAATSMDPKYDHIEKEERDKVIKEVETVEKYLHDVMSKQDQLPKHVDPIVFSSDLLKKKAELERFSNTILNKPKPKPKVEEKKPEEKKPEEKKPEEKKEHEVKPDEKKEETKPEEAKSEQKEMDLD